MSLGSDPHLPRQIRLPSRRIDTAVSFIDTSRPTYSAIFVLRSPAPKPARSRDGLAAPSHHHDRKSSSRLHAGSNTVGTRWGDSLPRLPHVDCAQPPGVPIRDIEQFRSEAIRFS